MQPQVENPPVSQPVTNDQAPPAQVLAEESKPDIKSEENQANWKAFREKRAAEKKAREDAERRASEKQAEAEALKAALEAITNKPSNDYQMRGQPSYEAEESDDDKMQRKIDEAIKRDRERQRKENEEREASEAPRRLLQTFPDYEKVVSDENCAFIEFHHPEIAAPFKYMPEGYEKWTAQYNIIKKLMPNADSKKDAVRAEKNMAKPGSMSSTGTTQGGSAMPQAKLDEQRKADNWARMQKTLKGLS
jgi:hypothetical protein